MASDGPSKLARSFEKLDANRVYEQRRSVRRQSFRHRPNSHVIVERGTVLWSDLRLGSHILMLQFCLKCKRS